MKECFFEFRERKDQSEPPLVDDPHMGMQRETS